MDTPKPSFDPSRVAAKALIVILIVAWLAVAAGAAVVLLIVAGLSVASFFGESPTGGNWAEGLGFALAGVVAAAAGPLGVWLFHRRRGWLIAAGYTGVITLVVAAYLLYAFGAE